MGRQKKLNNPWHRQKTLDKLGPRAGLGQFNPRRERRNTEAPPFEFTGTHLLILVAALLALAYDSGEDRRSCELRYTIQQTPERADDASHVSEEENEEGLGGLFDDLPDSEAESEPGSPDLMSAAWVERTARDPVLQGIMARGLEETGFDPASLNHFDITTWLEGLDLAQRREVISDIAVVRAQQDEINRRIAELHVNDQFPAGG